MARLACLNRASAAGEVQELHRLWLGLDEVDRNLLTDYLLADGILERSVRFVKLPRCLLRSHQGPPCSENRPAKIGVGTVDVDPEVLQSGFGVKLLV